MSYFGRNQTTLTTMDWMNLTKRDADGLTKVTSDSWWCLRATADASKGAFPCAMNMPQRILVHAQKQRSQHHYHFRDTSASLQSSLQFRCPSLPHLRDQFWMQYRTWQTAVRVHRAGRQLCHCATLQGVLQQSQRNNIIFFEYFLMVNS